MADRQNNARITVSVNGVDLGVFEDRTGGLSDSNSTVYPKGGLGDEVALGGRIKAPTPVIVTRLFDEEARGYRKRLRKELGKPMVVHEQPINDDHEAKGEPETFTGKLKSVDVPTRNASSDAAQTLVLEMITERVD